MELDASTRVFQARKMRPPSPDRTGAAEKIDWSIVAEKQVEMMLYKSRVVQRQNLKKSIEKKPTFSTSKPIITETSMQTLKNDNNKKNKEEKEVSTILANMTSFVEKHIS